LKLISGNTRKVHYKPKQEEQLVQEQLAVITPQK